VQHFIGGGGQRACILAGVLEEDVDEPIQITNDFARIMCLYDTNISVVTSREPSFESYLPEFPAFTIIDNNYIGLLKQGGILLNMSSS
jgi:hypothetical protein